MSVFFFFLSFHFEDRLEGIICWIFVGIFSMTGETKEGKGK